MAGLADSVAIGGIADMLDGAGNGDPDSSRQMPPEIAFQRA